MAFDSAKMIAVVILAGGCATVDGATTTGEPRTATQATREVPALLSATNLPKGDALVHTLRLLSPYFAPTNRARLNAVFAEIASADERGVARIRAWACMIPQAHQRRRQLTVRLQRTHSAYRPDRLDPDVRYPHEADAARRVCQVLAGWAYQSPTADLQETVKPATKIPFSKILAVARQVSPTPLLWQSRRRDGQRILPLEGCFRARVDENGAATEACRAQGIEFLQCQQIRDQVREAARACTAFDCVLALCAAAQAEEQCRPLRHAGPLAGKWFDGFTSEIATTARGAFNASKTAIEPCAKDTKEIRRCMAPRVDHAFTLGHDAELVAVAQPVRRGLWQEKFAVRAQADRERRGVNPRELTRAPEAATNCADAMFRDWAPYVDHLESGIKSLAPLLPQFPQLKELATSELEHAKKWDQQRRAICEKALQAAPKLTGLPKTIFDGNNCTQVTLSRESLEALAQIAKKRIAEEQAAAAAEQQRKQAIADRQTAAAARKAKAAAAEAAKEGSTRKAAIRCATACRPYFRCVTRNCGVSAGNTQADYECRKTCEGEITSECAVCGAQFR